MRPITIMAAAVALAASTPMAQAAPDTIKIGYISTLSGPAGSLGEEMLNAYRLGLEHTGGKLGGVNVTVRYWRCGSSAVGSAGIAIDLERIIC